jgi:hypothetical protein
VNIDRNREVRADRYEDISMLPSFEANCADEIYAGHVDAVKASFGRWFEGLKPGGRITITVPDCHGANRMWLERKPFPALELGPDEGIIAITIGVKAEDVRDREKETVLHHRVFDESTLRICMEAGDLSTSPRSITTKRWWRLLQRSAGNSPSRDTSRSRAEAHSAFSHSYLRVCGRVYRP